MVKCHNSAWRMLTKRRLRRGFTRVRRAKTVVHQTAPPPRFAAEIPRAMRRPPQELPQPRAGMQQGQRRIRRGPERPAARAEAAFRGRRAKRAFQHRAGGMAGASLRVHRGVVYPVPSPSGLRSAIPDGLREHDPGSRMKPAPLGRPMKRDRSGPCIGSIPPVEPRSARSRAAMDLHGNAVPSRSGLPARTIEPGFEARRPGRWNR